MCPMIRMHLTCFKAKCWIQAVGLEYLWGSGWYPVRHLIDKTMDVQIKVVADTKFGINDRDAGASTSFL